MFICFLSKISFIELTFFFPNKILNFMVKLNFKNNFLWAWINLRIFLSSHFCILFLIQISLLGAVSLTTFINFQKNQCSCIYTRKAFVIQEFTVCNSSTNTLTVSPFYFYCAKSQLMIRHTTVNYTRLKLLFSRICKSVVNQRRGIACYTCRAGY